MLTKYYIHVKNPHSICEFFYINIKVNPQLCWGHYKTYSFAQSNKKDQLKHDIIFKV